MYAEKSYQKQTTLLLGVFALITLLSAVYSDLFQAPQQNIDQRSLYQNPLNAEFLSQVHTISYISRIENLVLQKNRDSWHLTSPRKILADQEITSRLIESLKLIKVRKIYPKDTINENNFALNDPLLELKLESDQEVREVKLGMINPVDQSAYVALEKSPYIFQIEFLKFPIETFNLSDFIDSRLFIVKKENIQSLDIVKRWSTGRARTYMGKKNDEWYADNGRRLDSEKIEKYLNALVESRSHTIYDKLDETQEQIVNKFFEKPTYKIKIKTTDDKELKFALVPIYRNVPELKIQKKKHILFKSNQRHSYLSTDRDLLKILDKGIWTMYSRKR